jgi:hypothetical protein
MRIRVSSLAGELDLPPALLGDARVTALVDTLERRGGIERPVAERYAHEIVAHASTNFLEGLGREFGAEMVRVRELRAQLKEKYDGVLEHFSERGAGPGPLPADLQPEAFRRLFQELADQIQRFERFQPRKFAETNPPQLGVDVGAALKQPDAPAPPPAGPPPGPPPGGRGGGGRGGGPPGGPTRAEIETSLNQLEYRYRETLYTHPDAPGIMARFDTIRRVGDGGDLAQAARLLTELRRDLKIAETRAHAEAPVGSRADLLEELETGGAGVPLRYGRTKLSNIEGLRVPPDLPPDAPQVPLDRFALERTAPGTEAAVAEQAAILGSADPRTVIGNRFEAFHKGLMPPASPVTRHGRRPDIGDWEITIAGMYGVFGEHKVQQFWLDLVDGRGINLLVPRLSPEAAIQLRQLGQAAETLIRSVTGQADVTIRIQVIETLP